MGNINAENETPTNEEEQQPNAENESKTVEELTKELEDAKEYGNNQKIRAEKAEKPKTKSETKTPKKEAKPNEPEYAKLAWLDGKDVTNAEDQKMVMEEAERLKLPLTDVITMDYMKSKLKDSKDQRESESGSPKGKGKSGGSGQQDVDYHLAKGTTPPDVETASKVIDARMKKETSANKFSEELFSG